jgi:hypothetical protein
MQRRRRRPRFGARTYGLRRQSSTRPLRVGQAIRHRPDRGGIEAKTGRPYDRTAPQPAQNLLLGGMTLPQLGQAMGWAPPSGAPQFSQLAAPTLLAVSQ